MAEDAFKFANIAQHLQVGMGALAEGLSARKESKKRVNQVDGQASTHSSTTAEEDSQVVYASGTGKLDLPVILPQRRPKERSRGFLRAYAPLLSNVGIDQKMWLKFLDDFEQSTQATGWIKTINLASLASHVVPEPFTMLVSIAVKETIRIAEEIDARQKTNTFLDRANAEFFRPRGVICMVMTWRPDTAEVHPTMDLNTASAVSAPVKSSSFAERFKASNGTTYGDFKIPAAATLIFPPEAEQTLGGEEEEELGLKHRFKKTKAFVDDYIDRRAQAEYAAENPNNLLATQAPTKFRTKYSDPNHPASLNPLGSFLTGGYTDQVHLESKARADAAQAQAKIAVAEAQARSQQAIADAKARAAEAQARAGYVPASVPVAYNPYLPSTGAPGALVGGVPRPPVPVAPLNPLSQALVQGSQRLIETQQKYITAGTKAIQDVLRTDVIYLMVVSLAIGEDSSAAPVASPDSMYIQQ